MDGRRGDDDLSRKAVCTMWTVTLRGLSCGITCPSFICYCELKGTPTELEWSALKM